MHAPVPKKPHPWHPSLGRNQASIVPCLQKSPLIDRADDLPVTRTNLTGIARSIAVIRTRHCDRCAAPAHRSTSPRTVRDHTAGCLVHFRTHSRTTALRARQINNAAPVTSTNSQLLFLPCSQKNFADVVDLRRREDEVRRAKRCASVPMASAIPTQTDRRIARSRCRWRSIARRSASHTQPRFRSPVRCVCRRRIGAHSPHRR
jgi:hypothetical protein